MKGKWASGFFGAIAVIAIVVLPGAVLAATTCGDAYTLMPDGRTFGISVDNVNDDQIRFYASYQRSFCIEAWTFSTSPTIHIGGVTTSILTCPQTTDSEWVTRSTVAPMPEPGSFTPPSTFNPPDCFARRCGIIASSGSRTFTVGSDIAASSTVYVSVSETTLFNPRWSTYNGFLSSWGFQNTTGSTLAGKLYVNDGTTTYTKDLSLPAGKLTYVFSSEAFNEGTIGSDKAGNAWFAHDGPPGSVRADCYYAKSGVMIPSSFEPVRQNQH